MRLIKIGLLNNNCLNTSAYSVHSVSGHQYLHDHGQTDSQTYNVTKSSRRLG